MPTRPFLTAPDTVSSRVLGANIIELSLHAHEACMVLWVYPHPLSAVKDSDGHATYILLGLIIFKSRTTFTPELMSTSTDSSLSLVHFGPQGPQSTPGPWDSQNLDERWRYQGGRSLSIMKSHRSVKITDKQKGSVVKFHVWRLPLP